MWRATPYLVCLDYDALGSPMLLMKLSYGFIAEPEPFYHLNCHLGSGGRLHAASKEKQGPPTTSMELST